MENIETTENIKKHRKHRKTLYEKQSSPQKHIEKLKLKTIHKELKYIGKHMLRLLPKLTSINQLQRISQSTQIEMMSQRDKFHIQYKHNMFEKQ